MCWFMLDVGGIGNCYVNYFFLMVIVDFNVICIVIFKMKVDMLLIVN